MWQLIENEKEHRKETAEQSGESAMAETTDKSAGRSKHARNTKNLRKIEEPASAVLIKYIRGSYRKSWATIFCKVTCFNIDKPNTPP